MMQTNLMIAIDIERAVSTLPSAYAATSLIAESLNAMW